SDLAVLRKPGTEEKPLTKRRRACSLPDLACTSLRHLLQSALGEDMPKRRGAPARAVPALRGVAQTLPETRVAAVAEAPTRNVLRVAVVKALLSSWPVTPVSVALCV